jgi:hypothetical protein
MTMGTKLTRAIAAAGLAAMLCVSARSGAQLSLTAAGTTAGFTLSTFASGLPNSGGIGPIGVTITSSGTVLASDYANGFTYTWNDVDGQTFGSKLTYNNVGVAYHAMATTNGQVFVANYPNGRIDRLTNTGTFSSSLTTGLNGPAGLWRDPTDGNLWVGESAGNRIRKVDSTTGAILTTINVGGSLDGISVSNDGSTVYGSFSNSIQGFNTTTGLQVFNAPGFSGMDGTAIGGGTIAGFIFGNTNFGELWQVDLSNQSNRTLIASGGSRGDFVNVDTNDGCLLITQTDRIMRLCPAAGGTFAEVPEPGAVASMVGMGVAGLFILRRRKR